jgi:parvulin-like peptidyl-prolyl isomerase
VDLTFVRLPQTAFLSDIPVSDAERDAYVTQNADKLKGKYDELFDRFYNLPKRYEVSTILLRTDIAGIDKEEVRKRADAVHAEAVAGKDFAQLAKTWSEDLTAGNGGDLGTQAANQLDPVLVDAADKTGAGKISDVVETGRGFQILKVGKIEEARQVPFDEAKNDLAVSAIREEKVGQVVKDYAAKIIDAWKTTGQPPRELTEPKKLAVDSTGAFSLDTTDIPHIGESPELHAMLAGTPAGTVVPLPVDVKGTLFVVQVTTRHDADMTQFEAQKPMLSAQLKVQRQMAFFDQWRQDVVARAKVEREATAL